MNFKLRDHGEGRSLSDAVKRSRHPTVSDETLLALGECLCSDSMWRHCVGLSG